MIVMFLLVLLVYFWGINPRGIKLRITVISVANGERLNYVAYLRDQFYCALFGVQWGRLLAELRLRKLSTQVGSVLRYRLPSWFILLVCSLHYCNFNSCILQGNAWGREGACLLASLFCLTLVSRMLS